MSDGFLGEIRLASFDLVPKGWAHCLGQLLSVQTNQALFSLIGTTYGGDGKTTFALPDLRGRVVAGADVGNGSTNLGNRGEQGGTETVALTADEIPRHIHRVGAAGQQGTTTTPSNSLMAIVSDSPNMPPPFYGPLATPVAIDPDSLLASGRGAPHANVQPYLALKYMICVQGDFPST